jgi:hypothetical protein
MKFSVPVYLLLCLLWACGQSSQPAETTVQVPQDFLDFYEKFHRDSMFQMEHISWPLQGNRGEETEGGVPAAGGVWQPASWRMQRLDFNPDDYLRERQMLGDMMVIERIRVKAANYGIERRFAKQPDGEWVLIYYSDMQEVR